MSSPNRLLKNYNIIQADPLTRWSTIPVKPEKVEIEPVDLTKYLFDVKADELKKQLVFPNVPRGREQIEVQWIWIFGKPKFGKTTKSISIVNYALKSGKYDLDKTQIMQGEDFITMMENIKRGTEVAIMIMDDAHKFQSSFMMASTSGREHADMTFLARHIFKNQTGNPYGVLIIIANAQEFKSIHKWLRDQAVVVGYCGLIFEDPNIKTMPKAYVDFLGKITTHVEEYKDQRYKSYMVVMLPHKIKPKNALTISDYNNPWTTPYGYVNLEPIKRVCMTCKVIYKEFYTTCKVCNGPLTPVFEYNGRYIPYDEIVEKIEGRTSTIRDMESLNKREELVDKLYKKVIENNIDPLGKDFLDLLIYHAKHWLQDIEEIKLFDSNSVYFMRNIKGKYAAERHIQLDEDEDIYTKEIDLTNFTPNINENKSLRYNPSMINIFNKLLSKGIIKNEKHARMFKDLYFDSDGNFIKNPDERKYTPHDIAKKYKVDRAQVSKITGMGKRSIWVNMLYEMGHEYERWIAEQIKYNNALPLLRYDNIRTRKVFLGGDIAEPDIVIIGQRDGKVVIDIVSLKTTLYESSKTYYINPQDGKRSDIYPELKAFEDALKNREVALTVNNSDGSKEKVRIKLTNNTEVYLVILFRNVSYDDFEVGYRYTQLNLVPPTLTISYNKFKKMKDQMKTYIDRGMDWSEIADEFTNDILGVPITWRPQ